ncbi:RNA polymerase factor sigma-54 [Peribacillus simplex]|uniref:RNA polymerase factor sigma-54 n=1 Tax=Peribacillus simplex TaxID=1478 RepID=UPI0035C7898E
MIQVLQSLDPIGVGAKDLTDCLLIQLREVRITMNWHIRSIKSTNRIQQKNLQENHEDLGIPESSKRRRL